MPTTVDDGEGEAWMCCLRVCVLIYEYVGCSFRWGSPCPYFRLFRQAKYLMKVYVLRDVAGQGKGAVRETRGRWAERAVFIFERVLLSGGESGDDVVRGTPMRLHNGGLLATGCMESVRRNAVRMEVDLMFGIVRQKVQRDEYRGRSEKQNVVGLAAGRGGCWGCLVHGGLDRLTPL